MRKAQASIRESHDEGELGPEYDSFINLSEKWWSMLVVASPDGTLTPTAHGQNVADTAIGNVKNPKVVLPPDDDCAHPYKRGKWDDV